RRILADRIEHHRPRRFGDRFAQYVDALGLQPVEMRQLTHGPLPSGQSGKGQAAYPLILIPWRVQLAAIRLAATPWDSAVVSKIDSSKDRAMKFAGFAALMLAAMPAATLAAQDDAKPEAKTEAPAEAPKADEKSDVEKPFTRDEISAKLDADYADMD